MDTPTFETPPLTAALPCSGKIVGGGLVTVGAVPAAAGDAGDVPPAKADAPIMGYCFSNGGGGLAERAQRFRVD